MVTVLIQCIYNQQRHLEFLPQETNYLSGVSIHGELGVVPVEDVAHHQRLAGCDVLHVEAVQHFTVYLGRRLKVWLALYKSVNLVSFVIYLICVSVSAFMQMIMLGRSVLLCADSLASPYSLNQILNAKAVLKSEIQTTTEAGSAE